MVLVDTSVWIAHLRAPQPALVRLLEDDQVFCHPWVIGELALGSLRDRDQFLAALDDLPQVDEVPASSVRSLVGRRQLFSRGIGWVDAQLLAAAVGYPCRLWTLDGRLASVAGDLGLGWSPAPHSPANE